MKVKLRHNETRNPSTLIPIPENFSRAPESELAGSAFVIIDNETKSRYQWIPKKEALDVINENLQELKSKVSALEYKKAERECEQWKERISMCHSVFQKVTPRGRKSMTFRFV